MCRILGFFPSAPPPPPSLSLRNPPSAPHPPHPTLRTPPSAPHQQVPVGFLVDTPGQKLYRAGGGFQYTVSFVGFGTPLRALFAPQHSLQPSATAFIRVDGGACDRCAYATPLLANSNLHYNLRVAAANSVGQGPYTAPPVVAQPKRVPDAPVEINLSVVSGSSLQVSFREGDDGNDDIVK